MTKRSKPVKPQEPVIVINRSVTLNQAVEGRPLNVDDLENLIQVARSEGISQGQVSAYHFSHTGRTSVTVTRVPDDD